tara:strand:- start:5634 stop:6518 length:885 start_codon:yes stop_codon:yes gene_type:complete
MNSLPSLTDFLQKNSMRQLAVFVPMKFNQFQRYDQVIDLGAGGMKTAPKDLSFVLEASSKLMNDILDSADLAADTSVDHRFVLMPSANEVSSSYVAGVIGVHGEIPNQAPLEYALLKFVTQIVPAGLFNVPLESEGKLPAEIDAIVARHVDDFLLKHNGKTIQAPFQVQLKSGCVDIDRAYEQVLDAPETGNAIAGICIVDGMKDSRNSLDIIIDGNLDITATFEPGSYRSIILRALESKARMFVQVRPTRNKANQRYRYHLEKLDIASLQQLQDLAQEKSSKDQMDLPILEPV